MNISGTLDSIEMQSSSRMIIHSTGATLKLRQLKLVDSSYIHLETATEVHAYTHIMFLRVWCSYNVVTRCSIW